MTNSNDFCTQTTYNLCLLIVAQLIAEYKDSIEALAASEKDFLAKIFGYKPNPRSCRDFTSSQFSLVEKLIGLIIGK